MSTVNLYDIYSKSIDNPIFMDKSTKIRQYNIKSVPILPVTSEHGIEHLLITFSVDTELQYLKNITGMISKITFENPDKKEIIVKINGVEYTHTTDNYVSFTLPKDGNELTEGQQIQKNATNDIDKFTTKTFNSFSDGTVLKYYLNMSAIKSLELIGLSNNDSITLDMYTIMKSANGMQGVMYSSYSFSF